MTELPASYILSPISVKASGARLCPGPGEAANNVVSIARGGLIGETPLKAWFGVQWYFCPGILFRLTFSTSRQAILAGCLTRSDG